MSPSQELFDQLMILCEDFNCPVYDRLPLESENAPYPFIAMGAVQTVPVAYKSAIGGQYSQTIDVWADGEGRFRVNEIISKLALLGSRTIITKHYRFAPRPGLQDQQILTDTSVPDTVLMHGVITLVFNLS